MEQEEKKNYTTIADLENLAKEKYIELLKQGKLTDILDTMAKFPNITIDNDILVMTQMPEATKIDMKEVWEKKGRNLNESPKYINTIALCIYKNDLGYTDSKGTTYLNGTDKLTTKINTLYDVSQTEGKELPEDIDKEKLAKYFDSVKNSLEHTARGYKIVYDTIPEKSKIDLENKQIIIQNGIYLSEVMEELFDKVSTVLLDVRKQVGLADKKYKKIMHDATVYSLRSKYNFDKPDYDFSDVQKLSDEDMLKFKDNLQTVRSVVYQVSKNMENSIDFDIRKKERESQNQNTAENNTQKSYTKQQESEEM